MAVQRDGAGRARGQRRAGAGADRRILRRQRPRAAARYRTPLRKPCRRSRRPAAHRASRRRLCRAIARAARRRRGGVRHRCRRVPGGVVRGERQPVASARGRRQPLGGRHRGDLCRRCARFAAGHVRSHGGVVRRREHGPGICAVGARVRDERSGARAARGDFIRAADDRPGDERRRADPGAAVAGRRVLRRVEGIFGLASGDSAASR